MRIDYCVTTVCNNALSACLPMKRAGTQNQQFVKRLPAERQEQKAETKRENVAPREMIGVQSKLKRLQIIDSRINKIEIGVVVVVADPVVPIPQLLAASYKAG